MCKLKLRSLILFHVSKEHLVRNIFQFSNEHVVRNISTQKIVIFNRISRVPRFKEIRFSNILAFLLKLLLILHSNKNFYSP